MNYIKIYEKIVDNAENQNRVKTKDGQMYEKHHIIPKSVGGLNYKGNLVLLTPKEHYLCHRLLVEIYRNTPFGNKMYYAMWCMINGVGNQERYSPSSRIYDRLRKEIKVARSVERFTNRKPVLQYNLDGILIKRYGSVKDASEITGISRSSIETSGRGSAKTGSGFIWRYECCGFNEKIDPIVNEAPGRKKGGVPWNKGVKYPVGCYGNPKKIYQYSLKGEFLCEWDCINVIADKLKLNRSGIENCALNKSKSSGDFIWKYEKYESIGGVNYKTPGRKDGSIPWNKGKETIVRCVKGNRRIIQYSLTGEIINEWGCVLIASNVLNISKSGIHQCASEKRKTYKGCVWRYETN